MPEEAHVFQLTQPDIGFGGMVLKPWSERKRTAFQIMPEAQAMVNNIPGIAMLHGHAAAAATGGENFPVESRAVLDRRADGHSKVSRSSCSRMARPTACSPFRR